MGCNTIDTFITKFSGLYGVELVEVHQTKLLRDHCGRQTEDVLLTRHTLVFQLCVGLLVQIAQVVRGRRVLCRADPGHGARRRE